MPRAYVSIGSNVEPERNVRSALAALGRRYGALAVSTVYETDAVGFEGPPFYNLAAVFDTDEPPRALVAALHAIEDAHGRARSGPRYASRSLDLDLVLYDDLVIREPGLELPRPDLLRHAFVLGPLAEIAGAVRHPLAGKTLARLWEEFGAAARAGLRPVALQPDPGTASGPPRA